MAAIRSLPVYVSHSRTPPFLPPFQASWGVDRDADKVLHKQTAPSRAHPRLSLTRYALWTDSSQEKGRQNGSPASGATGGAMRRMRSTDKSHDDEDDDVDYVIEEVCSILPPPP